MYKIFSVEIAVKKNGIACGTCQGTVNFYSTPSTILDGASQTTLVGTLTNGIASFTSLSVITTGSYDFYLSSQFLQNDQLITNVHFNKAKLEVSVLNQVLYN